MDADGFYGPELAKVHHEGFGDIALQATAMLLDELGRAGLTSGLVVELGCGTGIMSSVVSDAGLDVLGIDISEAMLEVARRNAPRATFRRGSLIDAEFPPCLAVTAVGESLNYAADERAGMHELRSMMMRIFEALVPGGIFLFDVAGPGRAGVEGTYDRFVTDDDWVIGARSTESPDAATLRREMTILTRSDDGTYQRTEEHHDLVLFDPRRVGAALTESGFEWATTTAYSRDPGRSTPTLGGWAVFTARRPA
jgi:SAM-dependent methyltransferase